MTPITIVKRAMERLEYWLAKRWLDRHFGAVDFWGDEIERLKRLDACGCHHRENITIAQLTRHLENIHLLYERRSEPYEPLADAMDQEALLALRTTHNL